MLSHTSGLQNWRSTKSRSESHFTPGSRWLYSGEGYSYLQLVVAHLTGHVSTVLRKAVRRPRGLRDGDRCVPQDKSPQPLWDVVERVVWETPSQQTAAAHDQDGKPTDRPGATPIMAARYGAAGGLSTTATDYARFLIEVLDPKPSDAFRLTEPAVTR